jgi:hypothetical protein
VEELTRFLLDQKYVKGLTLHKHILWFPFGANEWDWRDGASGGLLCLDAPFVLALKVRGPPASRGLLCLDAPFVLALKVRGPPAE